MRIILFVAYLLLILIPFCRADDPNVAVNSTSVVLVQMVIRHGIRTIVQPYPTYPVPLSYWRNLGGFGALSFKGMKQMSDFGKYLRSYYGNFLNLTYDASRVYVRSNDYDRTIQSVQAMLSGLYPPANAYQQWDSSLNWFPIPVHTMSLATDNILHGNAPCARYTYLQQYWRNSSEYMAIQTANQQFISNMSNLSGISSLDYYGMWQIADNALVDQYHNISLAQWVIDNYNQIMTALNYRSYIDFATVEMGKLIAGGILNTFVTNMVNKITQNTSSQLYLMSVNDYYLSGIQRILNTSTEYKIPPFGSAYIFELRKDSANNYYVRVIYKNDTFYNPISLNPVTVYGCTELCPLAKFLNLTADKLVTNFDTVCDNSMPIISSSKSLKASFALMAILIVWLLLAGE